MANIIKFRYSGLWNSEYPFVVNLLLEILERHSMQALRLTNSYERLAAFRAPLSKIEIQERADSESALLSELDQQRDTFYNAIYAAAKAFQRMPDANFSNPAHNIVTLFKKHGVAMSSANYTAQTQRLSDLAADANAQPETMAALSALALKVPFERMCELNVQFKAVFANRKHRQGDIERVDVRSIRNECDKAITLLWSAIEHGIAERGAMDYVTLVNRINRLNAYYKQQLAARAARRKAKQAVEKEAAIVPFAED